MKLRLSIPVLLFCALPLLAQQANEVAPSAALETALKAAKENRAELESALAKAPADERPGMVFLIENMPGRDLTTLKAAYLLDNVARAYEARRAMPWGKAVPEEMFFNEVLPYASVTEKRDDWRKEMADLCKPMVKDCKTLAEAAQAINAQLFKAVKVKYSVLRGRPDQSPAESMKSGIASCTGLSILLVDACRSVGVPARIVGIPKWVNKEGNHTWVEIWDGDWHFTGACEPDPKGLDRAWFTGDASLAKKDVRMNSIYASSFKKTGTTFPLVWEIDSKDVSAVNVTERYTVKKAAADKTRVMVKVVDANGKRVAAPVAVVAFNETDLAKVLHGTSKDESADTNDLLTFELAPKASYSILIGLKVHTLTTAGQPQMTVEYLWQSANKPPAQLTKDQAKSIRDEAARYFASVNELRDWKTKSGLDDLLKEHESEVRKLVWDAYRATPMHADLKADREKKQVTNGKHVAAYTVKTVGKMPANGWPLFIAMHGGGNAPKELNDSQWKQMQGYYKDHAEEGGYLYVALRAPNDTWNGFYDDYVPPLIVNLIEQFTIVDGVDPDKVFLMGYSHGGYGAFYIGPKMPDRFAAIHASAAAPTDGTISAKSLRNTPFTFMIGGNDTAYGRRERCEKFAKEIEELKKSNPGDYPVAMDLKEGRPHSGLPDRDKIKEMYSAVRNPAPKHVTWEPMDAFIENFYWVSVEKPAKGQLIDLKYEGGKVTGTAKNVERIALNFDSRLIGTRNSVDIEIDGKTFKIATIPTLAYLCNSVLRRHDPQLAGTCGVILSLK